MKTQTIIILAIAAIAVFFVYQKYIKPTEKSLNTVNAIGGDLSNIIPSQWLSPIAKAPGTTSFY